MTPVNLRKLRPVLLGAWVALALVAGWAAAQTCTTALAPRGAVASSYMDTMLNGNDTEDAGFFTKTGGVPNIFFLLDNSASMVRLPPNGGGFYPGTYPPLRDPNCPSGGDAKDPNCQYQNLSAHDADCSGMTAGSTGTCPVIGCGDDPVSSDARFSGAGTVIGWFRDRQFFPPCQITTGQYGAKYGYDATGTFVHANPLMPRIDYAGLASACKYYAQGANAVRPASDDNKAGYDPDFYCGSNSTNPVATCSGQKPNLFDRYAVFHDTVLNTQTGAPGDGWSYDAVHPWVRTNNAVGSVDDFCDASYGNNVYQGTQAKRDICKSCLRNRGFFFDGRLFRASSAMDGLSNVGYPSIWFRGNWLNFYPPKFVVARKVLKDTVMEKVNVRMGIAHFGTTGADHTNNQWLSLKPTCDMPDSNWTSSRSTFMTQVDTYAFDKGTPIARALLDVGQYYHTPALPWFSSNDTTWNSSNSTSGGGSTNQQSVCYACQASTIVLITDGVPKEGDGNALPAGTVTDVQVGADYAGDVDHGILPTISGTTRTAGTGIPTDLCATCNVFPVAEDWKNNPIRVAWYLHNLDLRKNDEATLDCRTMNGKQALDVYTVGFATSGSSDAETLLSNMASMGGGQYVSADNTAALRSGLDSILTTIEDRTTSFSVASVSTLQTTAGRSVIVPRFDPAKETGRLWPGHLVRYELYSEFLNPTCTETSDGTGEGDLDCDGKCLSVFLQDASGDFIQEDDNGIFRKNDPPHWAGCDVASRCVGKGSKTCAVAGTEAATAHWDAAAAMLTQHESGQRVWRDGRRVYTAVDDWPAGSPDGNIDLHDTTFRIEANDTVAGKLMPYLRLGGTGAGNVCEAVATAIATRGDPDTAAAVRADRTFCAKTMIRFILGADVFNDNGAKIGQGDWPKAATDAGQDTLPDRKVMLGDIFHSAPVVVDPPLPADGVLCKNGLHNQCITSLWLTPTAHFPADTNAYTAYQTSPAYKDRRKIIVVGANDGLLHAFDAGTWVADSDDELTEGIDERLPPFNGYYTRGSGQEVWAFLPPDLIAKIPMLATGHQLFVDGSPMVRDVWVDGQPNGDSSLGDATYDGKKEAREFHTVAVVGERRGGTHYFALDLTDATEMPGATGHEAPKFLWIYPQPSSPESLDFGETYNDYQPSRPPIGPVRIAADTTSNTLFGSSTAAGTMAVAATGTTAARDVPYHERWVTFLAGGFDPQGVRGRGVHMVDAYTGHELFDFSRPTACASSSTDPRCKLRAPIAATVAMIMWGTSASANASFGNQGFYDTATFGDTAGQLWTLRFSDPGVLDTTTKRVKEADGGWYGGRSFQLNGCANEPFFYITANTQVPGGWLRTYAGTGDRYNLLDTYGGQCGPDNLRACAQRGCTVTVASASDGNTLACSDVGRETNGLALSACTSTNDAFFSSTSRTVSAASTLSTCTVEGKANVTISCGSNSGTTKSRAVSCSDSADGLSCGYVDPDVRGTVVDLADATNVIDKSNWYFSVRVFDDTAARGIFRTAAQAAAYDAARITVTDATTHTSGMVVIDGSVDAPTALADASSEGWAIYFNHDGSVTADDHTYTVSRYDERVSSTSALYGILSWSTLQPTHGTVVRSSSNASRCQVAKCVAENRRISYHYIADPVTGGSMLRDASGALVRSVTSTTLVPAMGDQPTVFVNQKGQVQVALTAVNPEKGATNITSGVMKDPAPSYGVIPVSRGLHDCRHAATAADAALVCTE